MMFLTRLVVARMVAWNTKQIVVLYGDTLSHYHLIAYFNQLRVKIKCDKHRLTKEDFCNRSVKLTSLVRVKGAKLE